MKSIINVNIAYSVTKTYLTKFTLDKSTELTALALILGDLLLAVTLYCGLFSIFVAGCIGFKSSSVFPDACKKMTVKYFFDVLL